MIKCTKVCVWVVSNCVWGLIRGLPGYIRVMGFLAIHLTLVEVYLSSKAPKVFLYADDPNAFNFILNNIVDTENRRVYVVIFVRMMSFI